MGSLRRWIFVYSTETLVLSLALTVICGMGLMSFTSDALSARPFHGRKRLWVEPGRSECFQKVKDLHGNYAHIYTSRVIVKHPINVRLHAESDSQITNMTVQEIVNKINDVKKQMYDLCDQSNYNEICQADFLFKRHWEQVDNSKYAVDQEYNKTFSIMQFNILAEGLSSGPETAMKFHLEEYPNSKRAISNPNAFGGFDKVVHPEICLNYNLRRWRILEVILGGVNNNTTKSDFQMSPDILGVEEIDNFYSFFQPCLSRFGYSGIFVPKRESPCVKFGHYSDGCALFWKSSKFQLVSEERRQFQKRGQVYIIATLQHLQSKHLVTVAVTHLKAKKGRVNERDRTAQAKELLHEAKRHAKTAQFDQHLNKQIPVVIMGDFNSDISDKTCTCIPTVLSKEMIPIYHWYPQNRLEELFTTLKSRGDDVAKRAIDYVFFNPRQVVCTHTLNMPSASDIVDQWGLPGFSYPSDHIMIGARFKIL